MSKIIKFVWDRIFLFGVAVAFLTSFIISCTSAKPIQSEIVVGPVSCKGEGLMFRCTGPDALWTLHGTPAYSTKGTDFVYYTPKGWTALEITRVGWGAQLWVRQNGDVTEFSEVAK